MVSNGRRSGICFILQKMKPMATGMNTTRSSGDRPLRCDSSSRRPRTAVARAGGEVDGFTLFELIIILVLVGLLSIIAVPAFLNEDLRVTPAADQIAGEIRYAQSLAMTRGEAHSFNVSSDSFSISKESGGTVPLSNGDASGSFDSLGLTIDGGGSGSVTFSSLFGAADGAHTIQVIGGGSSASVSVAGDTGYVNVQG